MLRKLISKLTRTSSGNIKPAIANIEVYSNGDRTPWSVGYTEFKEAFIAEAISDGVIMESFQDKKVPSDFGIGLDERVVEYPWIFSRLDGNPEKIVDAGSTFNFKFVVEHKKIKEKQLDIFTYSPEDSCFFKNRISYVFGDLRDIPYKNDLFDTVVSQSTIEHIDMDNSIYGYDIENKGNQEVKSYDYLLATSEMLRILKPGGRLLLTFPFGKFENHGFFQQFDTEMLNRILAQFEGRGSYDLDFFKYEKIGWRFANQEELATVGSFNPHTGRGKSDDGAAHCRSVCCISFAKQN